MLKKRFYTDRHTALSVQIPRAAKSVGLKCKAIGHDKVVLSKQTFPVMVEHLEYGHCIVAQYRTGKFLIQRPDQTSPDIVEE